MESGNIEQNGAAAVQMNPLLRFINIFHSPREVFKSLSGSKWAWIAPIILIFVTMTITYPFIKDIMADEQALMMENNPLLDRLPESQRQQIIEEQAESVRNPTILTRAGKLIGLTVAVLIVGAILLLLGNLILGGSAKYYDMLNVCSFSFMVLIPSEIIKTPIIAAQETLDIRTSLAIILPSESYMSFAHIFLGMATDIFVMWIVATIVIGMSVVLPRVSMAKIAGWLIGIWLLISAGLSLAISFFTGGM